MSQKSAIINNNNNNGDAIGCCTDYTVTGKCTMDSKENKEVKTRKEADMTPSPVFPKSSKVVQKCPKVSWSGPNPYFNLFLTITHLLDHFWTALDTLGKKIGLRVMSASSLVLFSLLSSPSTASNRY